MPLMGYSQSDFEKADVGPRIRRMRIDAGIVTLAQFSKRTGVHMNTLSNIETGRSGSTTKTLEKIAEALRCSVDGLFHSPLRQQEPDSVVAYLKILRRDVPTIFEKWTPEMWERYIQVCVRFSVANEDCARFFVTQIENEFRCIAQMRDLFDAGLQAGFVGTLEELHARLRKERSAVVPERQDSP